MQYLCLLIQNCKMIAQGIMSPCQVRRGGIKNRYDITPFPIGVCK
uniref:Alternative protein EFNA5 n=1 Tax=Homo sapiens TaxID=9606 RepID=L8E8V0_HUMAN|nr:alternative protein EFNA5 [Homo sapiens]